MLYIYYKGNGWSVPVNETKLRSVFARYCGNYGSTFEDWLADMRRQDLVRIV